MNAIASNSVLSQLYSNFCAKGHQSKIVTFLQENNSSTYAPMVSSISTWLSATETKESIGLTALDTIQGLRVQVIEPDGKTAYDSGSNFNVYANINKPDPNFLTNGKYLINENQNTRSYNMSAALSNTGISFQEKYSISVNNLQHYIAVRQGSQSKPIGNIVISMDTA
jgi:hypothetical protein